MNTHQDHWNKEWTYDDGRPDPIADLQNWKRVGDSTKNDGQDPHHEVSHPSAQPSSGIVVFGDARAATISLGSASLKGKNTNDEVEQVENTRMVENIAVNRTSGVLSFVLNPSISKANV